MKAVVSSLLFLLLNLSAQAQSACLKYEPAVVSLSGTVTLKTYPGPPNYESVADGDKPEKGWYLRLQKPICTVEDASDPEMPYEAEANVSELQLVLIGKLYEQYKSQLRVGSQLKIMGTLFHAHTGHHHTPVLLEVKTIEPTSPKSGAAPKHSKK